MTAEGSRTKKIFSRVSDGPARSSAAIPLGMPSLPEMSIHKNIFGAGVPDNRQKVGNRSSAKHYLSVLRKAFNDLGYVEGKNIHLEHRPAENPDRFQTMARELVDLKPDAIIAVTTLGAVDVKKFTNTIPIVFVVVADP